MTRSVLLIKTSSLGDVLHTLPALSDATRHAPDGVFHWVVEEGFAEVAGWHAGVNRVVPVALRRWRREPWQALRSGEVSRFVRRVRRHPYTHVLDGQGLMKSALLACVARGTRYGLDRTSAREPWASRFYHTPLAVPRTHHAIDRLRHLFALALHYPVPRSSIDYGLERLLTPTRVAEEGGYWVFLHGTTWPSKLWPEPYWQALAALCLPHGRVILPWGTAQEAARAHRLAALAPDRMVVPAEKTSLIQLATLLAGARAVVAVDTGPAHLAAALGRPVIGLYGPTDHRRIGTRGTAQHPLQGGCPLSSPHPACCLKRVCPLARSTAIHPPCFQQVTPERVWALLRRLP